MDGGFLIIASNGKGQFVRVAVFCPSRVHTSDSTNIMYLSTCKGKIKLE